MLRLTDIKLPLDHQDTDLTQAILDKLGCSAAQLGQVSVFKRGFDARNKFDIQLIYTLDIEVDDQQALLVKFDNDPHVRLSPDTSYKFVGHAPEALNERPVVIGLGPCG